jgi:hypothetical protein
MRTCLAVVAIAVIALATGCKKNHEDKAATPAPGSATVGSGSGTTAVAAVTPSDAAATVDATQAAAPAPIGDVDTFVTTETIGPLMMNMPAEAAIKALGGPPTAKTPPEEDGKSGLFASNWSWPGVTLGVDGDTRTGPFTVRAITLTAPSTYATKRGIKIGSSLADVGRAYPKSDEGSDDPTLFLVGSPTGGLLFETKGDVVVKIFFGATAYY